MFILKEVVFIPKILENIREKILNSAERILKKDGYAAMSVRNVAKDCGIAVGTIYNYFPGKEELAANIILKDWRATVLEMRKVSVNAGDFSEGAVGFYRALAGFSGIYEDIWGQFAKTSGSHESIRIHHFELRRQIAKALEILIANTQEKRLAGSVPLLAETILAAVNQPDMNEDTVRNFAKLLCCRDIL